MLCRFIRGDVSVPGWRPVSWRGSGSRGSRRRGGGWSRSSPARLPWRSAGLESTGRWCTLRSSDCLHVIVIILWDYYEEKGPPKFHGRTSLVFFKYILETLAGRDRRCHGEREERTGTPLSTLHSPHRLHSTAPALLAEWDTQSITFIIIPQETIFLMGG